MMEWIFTVLNAFLATLFIIFVPPLISCVIVIESTRMTIKGEPKRRNWLKDNELVKYAFSLHPNKGLSSQGLFWLAILMPLTYFVFLGAIAWNGYIPRLDAEGFKTFISISALPLGVLSLALPLSVSVARFHSSKQTAKQIEIVSQKNNLDLYHSHRKELFAYFDQVGEYEYHRNIVAKNKIHPRIHKAFFKGKPQDGMPLLNEAEFIKVELQLASTRKILTSILTNENPGAVFLNYLSEFSNSIYSLAHLLGLPELLDLISDGRLIPTKREGKNVDLFSVGTTSDEAIGALKYAENFFLTLCDFASYDSSYFIESDESKAFFSASITQLRMSSHERVIESLHRIEVFQALNEEKRRKFGNATY